MLNIIEETAFWQCASDAFANDSLELSVLPTEQCNLRCSYCYERFELGKMTDEVVSSVKNLIRQREPELRNLYIDWFGGEPLLALDVIEEISGFAQELASQNQFLAYASSVTTNGIPLTAMVAERLAQVNVRNIHVSIDGPAEFHDITRKSAGGTGTFSEIKRNLIQIQSSDIDVCVQLRVHVTAGNHLHLEDFADWLSETFLMDPRFSAYFFPIVDLGGPNQGGFPVLDQQKASETVNRLSERLHRPSPRKEPISRVAQCKSQYVCYAAKPNAWVIRSNGRLAKCTVGFQDERNDVGRLLEDGSLELKKDNLDIWMRGWTNGDKMSLHCPFEGIRGDDSQTRSAGGLVKLV